MALVTRTPSRTWVAREGQVILADAVNLTVAPNTTLSGAMTTATGAKTVEAACKNVTITPPETSWEKQDLLGKDSNGFQNQLLDEKPVGMATFTGTLLLADDEMISDFVVSGVTTVTVGATTYSRYQIGANNENEIAVCVTLNETATGASMVSFLLDNARVTKHGDVRVSGPDAHFEQDITVVCLAKDYYWEFKD